MLSVVPATQQVTNILDCVILIIILVIAAFGLLRGQLAPVSTAPQHCSWQAEVS